METVIRATVHGTEDLMRKVARLSVPAHDRALDVAVEAGAQLIRNDVAERAPYRTGNLRRSYRAERSK